MKRPAASASDHEKAIYAEHRSAFWLAEGNQAADSGNPVLADACFEKSQFWLDRYNTIKGY